MSSHDEAAARWFSRRDRGLTAEETAEFERWVGEPGHAEALARAGETWAALALLRALRRSSPVPHPDLLRRRRPMPRARLGLALAAAAAVGLFLGSRFLARAPVPLRYAAAEAATRFLLPDGSVAELSRGSEISLEQRTDERRVELIRGEAHFTVAKAAAPPFVVHARGVAIRDLGTAFDVRMESDRVAVFVTEGRVALSRPSGGKAEPTLLSAGQLALVQASSIDIRSPTALQAADLLAWEGHRLIFVNTPLAEAVARINRYNRRQLVVGDAETGAMLVGGSFQPDNVDAFVRLLDEGFGVAAETKSNGQIVLRKAR